jgi:hypothetical protein
VSRSPGQAHQTRGVSRSQGGSAPLEACSDASSERCSWLVEQTEVQEPAAGIRSSAIEVRAIAFLHRVQAQTDVHS